jgi:hypothetical protein
MALDYYGITIDLIDISFAAVKPILAATICTFKHAYRVHVCFA